jgi:archaellum component FlaC
MGNFTDSIGWKSFIIKFGGIASAVVIVGALFKIQHWPGASIMITVGMSSEVVIFMLSALDTFHPEADWSLVYPELKHGDGAHEEIAQHQEKTHTEVIIESETEPIATVDADTTKEASLEKERKKKIETKAEQTDTNVAASLAMLQASIQVLSPVQINAPIQIDAPLQTSAQMQPAQTSAMAQAPPVQIQSPAPAPVTEQTFVAPNIGLDLSKLDIDTTAISEGMKKFGESFGKFDVFASTVSEAKTLSEKLQKATTTVDEFTNTYGNSTKELSESVGGLSTAYQSASTDIAKVGKQAGEIVLSSGKQMSQVMEESTKILTDSYRTISDNINNLGKQACDSVAVSGKQMAQVVEESTKVLTDSYQVISNNINKVGEQACDSIVLSGKQLSQVISSAVDSFAETFTLIDQQIKQNLDDFGKGNNNYNKSVEVLNKNMSALNATYELQVQEIIKYQKKSSEINQSMEIFVTDLAKSTTENQIFYKEISHLNEHIAELNSIYGSMLSAMQTVTKKR